MRLGLSLLFFTSSFLQKDPSSLLPMFLIKFVTFNFRWLIFVNLASKNHSKVKIPNVMWSKLSGEAAAPAQGFFMNFFEKCLEGKKGMGLLPCQAKVKCLPSHLSLPLERLCLQIFQSLSPCRTGIRIAALLASLPDRAQP